MRAKTIVFAKFESIGQPHETIACGNMTVESMMRELIKWILKVQMGSKIRVTIGRKESDIMDTSAKGCDDDLLDFLDQITSSDSTEFGDE